MYGSEPVVKNELLERVNRRWPGELVIHRNGMPIKDRVFRVVPGLSYSSSMGVHNHSVNAVVSALTERFYYIKVDGVYVEPPTPVPGFFRMPLYTQFRDRVLASVPKNFPRLSRRQVVARFSGPKRKRYEAAFESLLTDPVCADDARIQMFCKFAKVEVGDAARIISPRSARFNLEFARYIKHLEKRIYKGINRALQSETKASVAKGMTVDDRARILAEKWSVFDDPVAVVVDVSKLDACTRKCHLKYCHSYYTRVYPSARGLRKLLKWSLLHKCVAYCPDGYVSVNSEPKKASGDVDTSLGNVIVVTSTIDFARVLYQIKIEVLNDGDDNVIIMERADVDQFIQGVVLVFRDAGFNLKIEQVTDVFEEIIFCQHVPCMVHGQWRMIREVRKVFRKDAMCLVGCPNASAFRRWLGAVGDAGLHLCDGVPVLQSFYQMYKRNGAAYSDRYLEHVMAHTHYRRRDATIDSTIDDAARVSFYQSSGILPDAQVMLETYLDSLNFGDVSATPVDIGCIEDIEGGQPFDLLTDTRI